MTPTEIHALVAPVWERYPEARPTWMTAYGNNVRLALQSPSQWHVALIDPGLGRTDHIRSFESHGAEALIEWHIDRLLERLAGEGASVRIDIPNDYLPRYGASISDVRGSNVARANGNTRLAAKVALVLAMGDKEETK